MAKKHDTLVFIPAWNEEDNLAAVLHELRTELPDADVLVVDDGSTDRTPHIAREQGAEVLSFGENRGLRAAIAAGYGYAAEHGYEYCGRVDADGQHPVEELRKLIESCARGRAMWQSDRGTPPPAETASPGSGTRPRPRGGWEPGCSAGRWRSSSTGRSTTRRAGCMR